ncbi:MAG: tRNA-dihydrouridine synthase [Spirochaetales bacterium]|nr:tRNA-dihydrouridine synthase [Spirochaetales bacterium]
MASFWSNLKRPFSVLAPMEDVTDTVFRQIIARYAPPDVFFTEFVNVDGMCSGGREAVIHRLRYTDSERPIVAQIWGLRPENFEAAARDIREMGFDGVDVNMGCSVKKVIKTGACARLIENPSLADEILRATMQGAGLMPVSVKTRIGYACRKTVEWAGFLLDHNLAALIVHGRIARETYDVHADWDEIRKVVSLRDRMKTSAVVIGNGDVTSGEQVRRYADIYGVDGVMIGRGALRNPLVFAAGERQITTLTVGEKAAMMREHVTLHRETWKDRKDFNVLKKYARTYISDFKGATDLRRRLMTATGYEEMLEILESQIKKQ